MDARLAAGRTGGRRGAAEERAAQPGSAVGPGRRRGGAERRRGPAGDGEAFRAPSRRVSGLGAVWGPLHWGRRGLVPGCPGEGKGRASPPLQSAALLLQNWY